LENLAVAEFNKKRATDNIAGNQLKILDLIEQENDPKDRAFLIVLQQINASLIANTTTINDIAEKLDTHLTAYESHARREQELIDTGKGMWRVGAWILGIVQTIAIAAIGFVFNNIEELKKTDSTIISRISVIEDQQSKRWSLQQNPQQTPQQNQFQ
jgi:hypothetical protein